MTTSPSEAAEDQAVPAEDGAADAAAVEEPIEESSPLQQLAERIAGSIDGRVEFAFDTAKVRIAGDRWVAALTAARDDHGLTFFSWLSAIDWSNDVAVGDKLTSDVDERYELLAAVSDLGPGNIIIFSTDLDRAAPSIASLTTVYPGANWHEREAAEMFGIDFRGHPQLQKLYLPDAFEGNPLRKSFPLLSRVVKPWPGTVDVEGMPGQAEDESSGDEPAEGDSEA